MDISSKGESEEEEKKKKREIEKTLSVDLCSLKNEAGESSNSLINLVLAIVGS